MERSSRSWEVSVSFYASTAMMHQLSSVHSPSLRTMYGMFIFRNSWTFLEASKNRLEHPENISIGEMRNWRPGELGKK